MSEEISAVQKLIDTSIEFVVNYSFELVGAILVLIAGFVVANWTAKFSLGLFEKKKVDLALARFLSGIFKLIVIAFAVIVALGKIGITITPLVAALSAALFGASFAIQGTLSNYAAGLAIIFARPFAIGDTITVKDVTGTVQDIKLPCTILVNADGARITIPNKHMVGEIVYNSFTNKISNSIVGISYASDPEKAIAIIQEVLKQNPNVVQAPAPQVGIKEFGDSSVNIGYRYWARADQYPSTVAAVNLAVYRTFKRDGVEIPFPQRDVHIVSQTAVA